MRLSPRYSAPSAQVQRAQKALPYTVTPIGGKAELAQWKANQIVAEREYQERKAADRAAARERAVDRVMNGYGEVILTKDEQDEIAYRKQRSAKSRKYGSAVVNLNTPILAPLIDTYELPILRNEPKKPLLTRIKAACANYIIQLFNDAFGDH